MLESAVNAFIVVNSKSSGVFSRDTEVHMPTYKPTGFAVVSGNTFAEAEPYKYFVSKGTGMKDNYMMWALMISGEFRYPAERKDIRTAYTYFNAWAPSMWIGTRTKPTRICSIKDSYRLFRTARPQVFPAGLFCVGRPSSSSIEPSKKTLRNESLRSVLMLRNTVYRFLSMRSMPCRVAAPRRIVLQKR